MGYIIDTIYYEINIDDIKYTRLGTIRSFDQEFTQDEKKRIIVFDKNLQGWIDNIN